MKMLENVLVFMITICIIITSVDGSDNHARKPYIVYMGEMKKQAQTTSIIQSHNDMLLSAIGDEGLARESKLHSYGKSFNGFAAKLLPHEVEKISAQQGVISVFPSTKRKLHTTRSWDFIGMSQTKSTPRNYRTESDIIVGVFDSGVWIDSPSFSDEGYGPPPAKWKGHCDKGANFTGCNNKVIGARYYNLEGAAGEEKLSPVDTDGHGTHTASTVAGAPVGNASLYGIGVGTARGGVPGARLAIYKVCWSAACTDSDILAAFDDAIADGVDVISLSLGGAPGDLFADPIAIGSFHAMMRGVLTSCSGGNDGPYLSTVQNVAPWIFTVGATGSDRRFMTAVELGNGDTIHGISINTFSMKNKKYALTDGFHAVNRSTEYYGNASACDYGTISGEKVKGKIVYCQGNNGQDYTIDEYGGIGTIMSLESLEDTALTPIIPGTYVLPKDGYKIALYINSTKNPTGVIKKTVSVTVKAPFVASFSARGPQLITPNILKPDITAPGIDILAAYPKPVSITGYPSDTRRNIFNIVSGTSMSCPHVAAAAAYVKSFHPEWSPAAIKSALMTTATPMMVKDKLAELSSGAGQINPTKALHPGLIYDIKPSSYVRFLCKEGYNGSDISLIAGAKSNFNCSSVKRALGSDGLNYPTMHHQLKGPLSSPFSALYRRTVTNVESQASVYTATVVSPKGLSVTVEPKTLRFEKPNERRSFKVMVRGSSFPNGTVVSSALLEWNDSSNHSVRSYILVYNPGHSS